MSNSGPERNLAVIPCRGGSKRVPKKNIRLLGGKPAVAYTIEAALGCGIFDSVVVSTDSEEIASIAREYGAEVPFLRQADLADDYTPVSAVTLDALMRVDPHGTKFVRVAQLMANCPLRNADDIAASYDQFVTTGADSQISVTEYGWANPWWAMTADEGHVLTPLFAEQLTKRSQELPTLLCPTGAVWWATAEILRLHGTFYAPGYHGWRLPWHRSADIDTEDDWQMTEALLRTNNG